MARRAAMGGWGCSSGRRCKAADNGPGLNPQGRQALDATMPGADADGG